MARTVPHCGLVILLIPNAVSLRARRRLIAASAVNTRASEKGDEPQGYSLTQNQSPAASVKKNAAARWCLRENFTIKFMYS
jgi:hypothetical protein